MKLHAHFKVIIGIVATLNIVAKAQPTPPAQANKDVGLLNGGSILRDGKYIQGKERIHYLLFLKHILDVKNTLYTA